MVVSSFNPSEKYAHVKLDHFPREVGVKKKKMKPPPRVILRLLEVNLPAPLGITSKRSNHISATDMKHPEAGKFFEGA